MKTDNRRMLFMGILTAVFCCSFWGFVPAAPTNAATDAVITVGEASVTADGAGMVEVQVDHNPGIAGFQMELTYDPSAVEFGQVVKGTVLDQGMFVSNNIPDDPALGDNNAGISTNTEGGNNTGSISPGSGSSNHNASAGGSTGSGIPATETDGSQGSQPENNGATTFSDLTGHWAANTVNAMVERKIISGYPDGSFHPQASISRAEIAAILFRGLDITPAAEADVSFADNDSIPA
ncbi:MAG: S-layer homology domain-containing protein [Bacillota bacterium]|nr:S-layer homology domain-containing protein [Bacillota bacterium]